MSVRMPHVHLTYAPRLVGRRPGDLDSLLQAVPVDRVDVIDPDRHPHAFVRRPVHAERGREIALAAAALAIEAEKNFALAGMDAAERRWVAPVPPLLPAEALEPGKALDDVR